MTVAFGHYKIRYSQVRETTPKVIYLKVINITIDNTAHTTN